MKTNAFHAKKVLALLFAALLPLVASAEKVEIDGIWYNLVSKAKQAEVISNPDGETKYSGSITIPATVTYDGVTYSVTSIGARAFEGCFILTAINIPEGVTSIGEDAFFGCFSLTAINIPEGVTSIGDSAFYLCFNLTAITLPESLTWIGSWVFAYCESLTAITLPENLTSIVYGVFQDCTSLTAITIPEGVTWIENDAFSRCTSLTDVYCHAVTVPSTELSAFDGSNIGQATLHVPASALESYKATEPWSRFGTIVALTDEEMGVEQLTIDNAQLTIYDLHGRRVATPTKDGIYIVNGRKVMVKIGM